MFYIISKLSRDQVIQPKNAQVIYEIGSQPTNSSSESIYQNRDEPLEEPLLPIGWERFNRNTQSNKMSIMEKWKFLYSQLSILNWIGWIISGVAISMGISFWQQLFRRLNRNNN